MQPRLLIVNGPLEGRTFALEQDPFTLGRYPASTLQLAEAEVSRHHGEIRRDGARFLLRDLDSRHGTFVNSVPIAERALAHGDVVRIGRTHLLFLLDETPAVPPASAAPGDLELRSTVHRLSSSSIYLQPHELRALLPAQGPAARIASDLDALLEISTALHAARDRETLGAALLDRLMPALAAERVALWALDPGEEDAREIASRSAADATSTAESRRVLAQTLAEGSALLAGDPRGGSRLCVPLIGHRRTLGALLCETTGVPLPEPALELAKAAAAIAAIALENLDLLDGLRTENRRLLMAPAEHGLLGESAPMRKVLETLARLAAVDSTVLLRGASGTGKRLAARALHHASPRADRPFVAVNCATLSQELLASELFGHERGAFTGAVARKIGKLEAAEGGTLFLDEIAEIPPPLQAQLLRAIQEREIERVGGTRPLKVDVRLVAATHRDLEAAVRAGSFREDLFYRLNVIAVTMPALSERRDDIPLLASHFAAHHGRRLRRREIGLSHEARRLLMAYDWPGNVRQLANAIERAVVLGDGELIRPEDLPDEVLEGAAATAAEPAEGEVGGDFQAAVIATKKKLLLDTLAAAGGNAAEAGRRLGLHPNSFRRLLRQLGLKTPAEP